MNTHEILCLKVDGIRIITFFEKFWKSYLPLIKVVTFFVKVLTESERQRREVIINKARPESKSNLYNMFVKYSIWSILYNDSRCQGAWVGASASRGYY